MNMTDDYKTAFYIAALFTGIDFIFHYFIEQLSVPQPMYSVNKFIFTFVVLIILSRYVTNKHILAALIVIGLENRYSSLYLGRLAFGLNFNYVLIVLHYLILVTAITYVTEGKLEWPWRN